MEAPHSTREWFFFGNLPQNIVGIISPAVLLIVGFLVERNFVGRIATFTNSLAINLAYYGKDLASIGGWQTPLIIYLNIGLIMGIISIISYNQGISLGSIFYSLSWVYSSIVAGAVVLLATTVPYPLSIPTPTLNQ
jgi:hypothetical protein